MEAAAEGWWERGEVHRLLGDVAASRAAYAEAGPLGRDPQVEVACTRADGVASAGAAGELGRIAATYRTPGFTAWAEHTQGAAALCRGEAEAAVRTRRASDPAGAGAARPAPHARRRPRPGRCGPPGRYPRPGA